MSWGIRITILYTAFVILIGTMVALTMREKVDLVSDDYYQQELKFQQKLDRENCSSSLGEQPVAKPVGKGLSIVFPAQMKGKIISGDINFFRASDASKDFKVSISADSSATQLVPAEKFVKGLYQAQLSWSAGGKNYYNEIPVYIP